MNSSDNSRFRYSSGHIPAPSVESAQTIYRNNFGHGGQVLRGILGVNMRVTRHQDENVKSLPFSERWWDGMNQPTFGSLPTEICQLWSERLVITVATGRACLQQLHNQRAQNVARLLKLWFPPTKGMDEGTRSTDPRGWNLCPLDTDNAPEGKNGSRNNPRSDKQILQPKS